MRHRLLKQASAGLLLLTLSCGVTGGGGGDSADRLGDAWRLYQLRQYEQAAQLFQELALDDVELAESYGGLGWSKLRQLDPAGARLAFQSSLIGDAGWTDSRAGELFALRDAGGNAELLLNRGRSLLQVAPTWHFSRESAVDWRDLQVLMAQVFYYSQRFDSSLSRCLEVDDAIALSRADSLSWQGASSFEAALLQEVQRLSALVAD